MPQFVYVLSNSSMPGLVKVGKTTTSPSQRMSELHTTGVPTPFELELSLEVPDCSMAENELHRALGQYRVSSGREFFRVTVREAIVIAIKALDECAVAQAKKTHGIEELILAADADRRLRLAQRSIRDAETAHRKREQAWELAPLVMERRQALQDLTSLGTQPSDETSGGIAWYLMWCFIPIPVGAIVWAGAFGQLPQKYESLQILCIALLIAGFVAFLKIRRAHAEYERSIQPWLLLRNRRSLVEEKLSSRGWRDFDAAEKFVTCHAVGEKAANAQALNCLTPFLGRQARST